MDSPPSSPSPSAGFNFVAEGDAGRGADGRELFANSFGLDSASPGLHAQQQQQQQQGDLQQQQEDPRLQHRASPSRVAARPERVRQTAASSASPSSSPVSAFARCATPADVDRIDLQSLAPSRRAARRRTKAPADLKETVFTYAQVKEIVRRALEQREQELTAEYDATLQERLSEQFQNFSRFSHNEVARQYKDSDFSYLS
jgi:hypothetical protein